MLMLRKFVVPELIFGVGAMQLLAQYVLNFGGQRVFIVTDPGVMATGLVTQATDLLSADGIDWVIYSGVSENPRDFEVMKGAREYVQSGCDVIVALGGGSPIDCAKGIGVVSTNQKHVSEFEGVDNVNIPAPPLICVPTTSGSSADISQFAIINNTSTRKKFAIISKAMVPDVALIDPTTTLTMSPYLTACTGIDVLTHAIEAYVSRAHSSLTDVHALKSIELIIEFLPKVMENDQDTLSREQVMVASLHAGLAFSNASLGAVHAMAHCLGGFYDIAHGECNALLLEHVVAYNYQDSAERYQDIGNLFGISRSLIDSGRYCEELTKKIRHFRESVGVYKTLGQRQVVASDLPLLAASALQDPCMLTNPRHPSVEDVEKIFHEAL